MLLGCLVSLVELNVKSEPVVKEQWRKQKTYWRRSSEESWRGETNAASLRIKNQPKSSWNWGKNEKFFLKKCAFRTFSDCILKSDKEGLFWIRLATFHCNEILKWYVDSSVNGDSRGSSRHQWPQPQLGSMMTSSNMHFFPPCPGVEPEHYRQQSPSCIFGVWTEFVLPAFVDLHLVEVPLVLCDVKWLLSVKRRLGRD